MDYAQFLHQKLRKAEPTGFEPADLNPHLFAWQADLVRWACRQGRCGIFADTGLGKTLMQLAWAEQVARQTGGRVLILCPLAVAQQTRREAERFGIGVPVDVARDQKDADAIERAVIVVTNYERLHLFNPAAFAGVVLDESSILKAYTGKTKRRLCELFAAHRYKLCCTATPSPNDHMELGNHSEFVGVMPSSEMLSRWFQHDSMRCGAYRLRRHGERDFWRWVTSWAVAVQSPADLGYPGDDYRLPRLMKIVHEISANDCCPPPPGALFHFERVSATNLHRIKRATAAARAAKVAELVRSDASGDPWLIWCDTDYEADALKAVLWAAIEIRGSHSIDWKEANLAGFSDGRVKYLITKPEVAGFGLNWQHCHKMAFVGASFSFERFYQAVRRCWRYGQHHEVWVHVVTTDVESSILEVVAAKEAAFAKMRAELAASVRESQLENLYGHRKLKEAQPVRKHQEDDWTLYEGDAVEAVRQLADASVGLTVFSPPFSNLYIYTDSVADMGNTGDDAEFFEHFGYLVPELLRVTTPGRLCCVHCKDLPLYFSRDGAAGLRDFPGEVIRAFGAAGWTYHSRLTIWKDPVIEMQRTKNNGLLHKTLCRDSSQCRQGMADYLLVFRHVPPATLMSDAPVQRPHSRQDCFTQYIGSPRPCEPSAWAKAGEPKPGRDYGLEVWQRYASPVWFDIDQTRVLNYRQARGEADEKHICPLQLDVIERCLDLWSNPGDLVFSPFAGIGSEGYCAIRMGRRFAGSELKDSYVEAAIKHLRTAVEERRQKSRSLFSDLELTE